MSVFMTVFKELLDRYSAIPFNDYNTGRERYSIKTFFGIMVLTPEISTEIRSYSIFIRIDFKDGDSPHELFSKYCPGIGEPSENGKWNIIENSSLMAYDKLENRLETMDYYGLLEY